MELFQCDDCDKTFPQEDFLIMHRRVHSNFTPQKTFSCDFCPEAFSYITKSDLHLLRQQHRTSVCPVCKNACCRSEFAAHLQTHIKMKIDVREICQNTFDNKDQSDLPCDSQSSEDEPCLFSCEECDKMFPQEDFLIEHQLVHAKENQLVHAKEKTFSCDLCPEAFSYVTNSELSVLRQQHKLITCRVCQETCCRSEYTAHLHMHIKKIYACDSCPDIFHSEVQLNLHRDNHLTLFTCDICQKNLSSKGHYDRHRSLHDSKKGLVCDACQKTFTLKSRLTSHRRSCSKLHCKDRSNEKTLECDVCKKSFAKKNALQAHRRIHSNEKRYHCEMCQKGFAQKGSLYTHRRVHVKEKRFTCEFCQKVFTFKCNLDTHLRTHSKQKPFVCQMCNRAFSQSSSLKTHLRVHTQEKPFACEICQRTFSQKPSLHWHLRTHKDEKPFACS